MNDLIAITQFVAEAVLHVWPLFLISILLSVLIRALKLDGVIRRAFNANAGAAIAFLIAGSVTTIPAMTAVYGVVQKRVFALYLCLGLFGAMIMGVVANLLLG